MVSYLPAGFHAPGFATALRDAARARVTEGIPVGLCRRIAESALPLRAPRPTPYSPPFSRNIFCEECPGPLYIVDRKADRHCRPSEEYSSLRGMPASLKGTRRWYGSNCSLSYYPCCVYSHDSDGRRGQEHLLLPFSGGILLRSLRPLWDLRALRLCARTKPFLSDRTKKEYSRRDAKAQSGRTLLLSVSRRCPRHPERLCVATPVTPAGGEGGIEDVRARNGVRFDGSFSLRTVAAGESAGGKKTMNKRVTGNEHDRFLEARGVPTCRLSTYRAHWFVPRRALSVYPNTCQATPAAPMAPASLPSSARAIRVSGSVRFQCSLP